MTYYRMTVYDNEGKQSVDTHTDEDVLRKEVDEAMDMLEGGKIKTFIVSRVRPPKSKEDKPWWDK